MKKVPELLKEVEANGYDVWVGGAASPGAVAELEGGLGIELPPTLKAFLVVYGAIGVEDSFVSGIVGDDPLAKKAGGIYGDTLFMRQDFAGMPASLWVVQKHEDGAYCMDANRPTADGELAIVDYEGGSAEYVASSFDEFLCDWFLDGWAEELG